MVLPSLCERFPGRQQSIKMLQPDPPLPWSTLAPLGAIGGKRSRGYLGRPGLRPLVAYTFSNVDWAFRMALLSLFPFLFLSPPNSFLR